MSDKKHWSFLVIIQLKVNACKQKGNQDSSWEKTEKADNKGWSQGAAQNPKGADGISSVPSTTPPYLPRP